MDKKRLLTVSVLVLMFCAAILISSTEALAAEKCQIIRINKEKGTTGKLIRIVPETLNISKNTCVIWVNWVPAVDVRVVFREEAKACQDATSSPAGFSMSESCYLTDFLRLGGTSSLLFNEAGVFEYEIQVPDETKKGGPGVVGKGELEGKGKIIVK